ncbi:unnamed protein product [Didymodactylos carnosus]|uniref:Uncharacterized protein n=1 Tax=Didymodactylos carnosus TaxID=1234261 RepID=A0A815X768_9BILA|nr:unnamed protein product [Didymodactylos carnosus]CAF4413359.1 unnamed protein product [Didymodactylos carnosus]
MVSVSSYFDCIVNILSFDFCLLLENDSELHLITKQTERLSGECIDYFRVDPMVLADHWLINGGIYYWEGTKSIVKLKIEQMFCDLPFIFIGIRSKHCELSRPFSMTSKSFYGWAADCPADVCLNGMSEKGYGGFHGILEGDLIELGINSQEHKLELDIKCRTPNKHFEISIDLQYCPFPWQIHLNMYHGEDCVRVIL